MTLKTTPRRHSAAKKRPAGSKLYSEGFSCYFLGMSQVKLRPSFWDHDQCIPFSRDVGPASIFENNQDYLVFDIETKEAVPMGVDARGLAKMGVSVACAWDSKTKKMLTFFENDLGSLIKLMSERLVIGFNIRRFDIPVLVGYGLKPERLDVFDILDEVERILGHRVKLDYIAQGTLGEGKSAHGLQAVEWFKEGKMKEIADYCAVDVDVTHKVFRHGLEKHELMIKYPEKDLQRIEVDWS